MQGGEFSPERNSRSKQRRTVKTKWKFRNCKRKHRFEASRAMVQGNHNKSTYN